MTASILVVEDEPAIQELVCVTLARNGHEVRRAASAAEANSAIAEALPDLVLLDWMLPDGSGPALTRKLRADSRTREVPIIMLTARAGDEDKVAGLEAGADDYVTKPFSPRELEARIQAVLRRRAPQLSKEEVSIEGLVLNPATRVVAGKGRSLKMGPTEFELLHFFMTHTDRVYSRTQILDQVWGDHV
ncbi:MAG TPA: response regulator, partial [Usitatibacter sp.]|nr:response regulator [Usitatibacter sp.]